MKKKFFNNRKFWIIKVILIIVSVGGIVLLSQSILKPTAVAEPALQTSKVRKGDLVVSAAGSGSVLSSAQAELGFSSNGIVAEVYVTSGQQVTKGDVLARLENKTQQIAFQQAEANVNSLFTPAGIANFEIDVVNAQTAYNVALGYVRSIDEVIGTSDYLTILKADVIKAQSNLEEAEEKLTQYIELPDDDVKKVQAYADIAQARMDLDTAKFVLAYYENPPDSTTSATYKADLEIAKSQLDDAKLALSIVQTGDKEALEQSLAAVDGTSLAKLKSIYLAYENARTNLENTFLVAPFDGVVINVDIVPGQSVSSSPVLTLASMDSLQVKFFMDETDLAGLLKGNRTIYTFNAYPETSLEGEVFQIERALQVVDGSPMVVVWGTLPDRPSFEILVGMTVDVEIIAGESHNTLLMPVQALRELTPGSYAAFVVQSDGSLKLTPITIGLRDFANVEILSGLKAGDLVSTGNVETK